MDIIRRNTDYTLRLLLNLARRYGKEAVSSRVLAEEADVSYQLTCKLMQKLHGSGLVKSKMGPYGGYYLCRPPLEVTLASVVELIQGPVSLNSCLFEKDICSRQPDCTISKKLSELQEQIEVFFNDTYLSELC
jgi:Rrf2 family protein